MKPYTLVSVFISSLLLCIGCSSPKQFSIVAEEPEAPDMHIQLQIPTNLLTADVGEYVFEPIVVTGKTDWDFLSEAWQYQENHRIYLRKLTLDIKVKPLLFADNRKITVHLNNDTVYRDKNSPEYVDFRGDAIIRLTHHIGIATFKGDILDAPTR